MDIGERDQTKLPVNNSFRHFFEDRNSYLVETIRKLRLPTNNSFEKYCTELLHPSCKAEPSESVSPPEQLRRIVSDTQSESGSVANSLQSSSIFSVSYKKSEHRARTESVISGQNKTVALVNMYFRRRPDAQDRCALALLRTEHERSASLDAQPRAWKFLSS